MERRKPNRLEGYDYSTAGAYFITICTRDRANILWEVVPVGAHSVSPSLTFAGKIVEWAIQGIEEHYTGVKVDHFVIMPNHIHLLLRLEAPGRTLCAPTDAQQEGQGGASPNIPRIVKQMKETVTKRLGRSIFQKSYHDHIIRNQEDYLIRWNYIDTNPARWAEDEYYG